MVCLPARGTSQATGKKCTVTGYGYMGESKYSAKPTFILLFTPVRQLAKSACTVTEYGYMGESKLLTKADICFPFYTSQVPSKKFMAIGFGKLKAKTTFILFVASSHKNLTSKCTTRNTDK